MQYRILVTAAGGAGGANFISSLRLDKTTDYYLVGTDTNKYLLELTSGLDKKYIIPRATDLNYIDTLNTILKKEKIDFVHFQSEEEVWFASHYNIDIQAKILLPRKQTLLITYNKAAFNIFCKENDIKAPASVWPKNKKDLEQAIKILKKGQKQVWLRAITGGGSRASLPVYNIKQAEGWIDYWKSKKGYGYTDFMVSEFLPGKEFAFQSIWYKGNLVTSMVRERVEYLFGHLFPSGQSSSPSVAKTVHRDDINKLATKAIKTLDSHAEGIFCVDIKENKDGVPCITEVNAGRFYTTSNNFSTAGINMPSMYTKLGLGEKLKESPKQYNGIPAGWYWVRMIDMGYKLIKGERWTSIKL